jgi:hypothetical protein
MWVLEDDFDIDSETFCPFTLLRSVYSSNSDNSRFLRIGLSPIVLVPRSYDHTWAYTNTGFPGEGGFK